MNRKTKVGKPIAAQNPQRKKGRAKPGGEGQGRGRKRLNRKMSGQEREKKK